MAETVQRQPLGITELVLRDAHQSLLATRMRIDDMLPIAAELDQRSGSMDVSARDLRRVELEERVGVLTGVGRGWPSAGVATVTSADIKFDHRATGCWVENDAELTVVRIAIPVLAVVEHRAAGECSGWGFRDAAEERRAE